MMTDLAWKIPDNISYEQAATVSIGVYSAAMSMSHPTRLDMAEWPGKVANEQWVSVTTHTRCIPWHSIRIVDRVLVPRLLIALRIF